MIFYQLLADLSHFSFQHDVGQPFLVQFGTDPGHLVPGHASKLDVILIGHQIVVVNFQVRRFQLKVKSIDFNPIELPLGAARLTGFSKSP